MKLLIASIFGWFAQRLAYDILISLGLGLVTFTVITEFIESYIAELTNAQNNIPAAALQLMGLAGVDVALSAVLSAVIAAAAIKTMRPAFTNKS